MHEPSEALLRKSFSKLSLETLRICASCIDASHIHRDGHVALVARNCREVIAQGVEELLTGLLEDVPEEKHRLLSSIDKTQEELTMLLIEDTLGCLQYLSENDQKIIARALDIAETSPNSICEQIFLNGLDAFLSKLAKQHKLEPLAKEFGVHANAEDAVEQIIEQVFPPSSAVDAQEQSNLEVPKQETQAKKEIPAKGEPKAASPERISHTHQTSSIRNSRPPLQKGIALDDIQNLYWVGELRQFCKEHSLKGNGKKSHLNRLVFNFLNTGETPDRPKRRGAVEGSRSKRPKPPAPVEPQSPTLQSSDPSDSSCRGRADAPQEVDPPSSS